MIRVKKREDAPKELVTKGYGCDEVKKAILEDQYDKCYICERKVTTDYQVEHLVSQTNNEDKVNEWGNLFIACNYCNDKKKTSFDGIAHPDKFNVEDVITHDVDLSNEKVLFSTDSKNEDILLTVKMLDRMFNGTHASSGRVLMESRFYNIFKMKYNHFQGVVNDYLAGKKEEMRPVIEELVDIGSEYLAFKYYVIMQNTQLRSDFQHLLKWNQLG